MSGILGNISLVSGFTILSRVLGLLRDMLFFACFGGSYIGGAFVLAFTLPNLFRRMLGEGTLSSAFIPVFSETIETKSLAEGLSLLNKVLTRLALGLIGILLLGLSLFFLVQSMDLSISPKWRLGVELCSVTLPYVLAICLSALIVGALNARKKFSPGASSPIILNFAMIATLGVGGIVYGLEGEDLALALCVSVLIGGVLQLLAPAFSLHRLEGWKYKLDFGRSDELSRIRELFVVGAFGAAVGQVNVLVSRFLGYSLPEDGAVSMLFLTSRLTELPLGVFAIAIATVVFPEMARLVGQKDESGFRRAFTKGLRLTLVITLPAAMGLALLAEPILVTLFQWGRFGSGEVAETVPVLMLASFGLPFYAVAAFYIRGFHARKDMKTPLLAAFLSLVANVVLSLVLMQHWGVLGLAGANGLAAVFQTLYLVFRWRRESDLIDLENGESSCLFPTIVSTVAMCIVVAFGHSGIERLPDLTHKASAAISLVVLIPLALAVHFVCLWVFSFPEVRAVTESIKRRVRPPEEN